VAEVERAEALADKNTHHLLKRDTEQPPLVNWGREGLCGAVAEVSEARFWLKWLKTRSTSITEELQINPREKWK
jgi:hypothetical protein